MQKNKGANSTYFGNILEGIKSSWTGLRLSLRHFKQASQKHLPNNVDDPDYFKQSTGIVTLQYPYEALPIPDNGRYRLHNEMDDCIVCDKCAKVCPVDCIDIEPIKATEQVGTASDGSPIRLYAAKFDIDMAKCCYCGLCTTVCPTECLTMTKSYDYSETDVRNMNYHFSNISPEQAQEKMDLLVLFQKEKEEAKAKAQREKAETIISEETEKPQARPKFTPKMKAKPADTPAEETEKPPTRPKFTPKMKAKPADTPAEETEKPPTRPKFTPKMKAKPSNPKPEEDPEEGKD